MLAIKDTLTVEDALRHFTIATSLHSEFDCPLHVVQSLVDKLDSAYYRTDSTAIVEDRVYDYIKQYLAKVNPTDERLTRVGVPYDARELRNKVPLAVPMGSLDNTDGGIDGFEPWLASVREKFNAQPGSNTISIVPDFTICASLKVDGGSICASYKNGKLERVATRGNGTVGEDITANAVKFIGVPSTLSRPLTCEVRGEAILYKADFRDITERDFGCKFDEIDPAQLSNPRNVGNGALGRSDGADCERIRFMAFNIVTDERCYRHSDKCRLMQDLGFAVVPYKVCETTTDVVEFYNDIAGRRDDLPFEIDGLVVVLDRLDMQQAFITDDIKTQLRPKHSRAIKFPHRANTTIIEDVLITVGHTGAIIPTAVLKEARVGGVNVTHALLNNWDEIERLGIAIGDEVEIALMGDIIPKCLGVVKQAGSEAIYRCPECGFEGTVKEQELHHATA